MPKLLDLGHRVTVYDSMYFGDHFLPTRNLNLKMVKCDIRDAAKLAQEFKGIVAVIAAKKAGVSGARAGACG